MVVGRIHNLKPFIMNKTIQQSHKETSSMIVNGGRAKSLPRNCNQYSSQNLGESNTIVPHEYMDKISAFKVRVFHSS